MYASHKWSQLLKHGGSTEVQDLMEIAGFIRKLDFSKRECDERLKELEEELNKAEYYALSNEIQVYREKLFNVEIERDRYRRERNNARNEKKSLLERIHSLEQELMQPNVAQIVDCDAADSLARIIEKYRIIRDVIIKITKYLKNLDEDELERASEYFKCHSPEGAIEVLKNKRRSKHDDWICRNNKGFYADKNPIFDALDAILSEIDSHNSLLSDLTVDQCEDVEKILNRIEKGEDPNLRIALALMRQIINDYEDLHGSVRVYIRINDYLMSNQDIKYSDHSVTKDESYVDLDSVTYGPFYGVFENVDNTYLYCGQDDCLSYVQGVRDYEDEHAPGIAGVLDLLNDSYSVALYAYGYSGSGKTYTMFGKGKTNGLLQKAILGLSENAKVKLHSIRELRGTWDDKLIRDTYDRLKDKGYEDLSVPDYLAGNDKESTKKFILGRVNTKHQWSKLLFDYEIEDHDNVLDEYSDYDFKKSPGQIDLILKKIRKARIDDDYIMSTPNNPESSRSHLFLTFEIEGSDTVSYLTIVDMAGIEDPYNLIKFYCPRYIIEGNNIYDFMNDTEGTVSVNMLTAATVIDIAKSDYEINESLIRRKFSGDHYDDWRDESSNMDSAINLLKKLREMQREHGTDFIRKMYHVDSITHVIKQAFFINESLMHMRYFFETKNDPDREFNWNEESNRLLRFTNNDDEPDKDDIYNMGGNNAYNYDAFDYKDIQYHNDRYFVRPDQNDDVVGMRTILSEIDELSGKSNPSKHVMIATVRPDKEYHIVDGARLTLEFADSIRAS